MPINWILGYKPQQSNFNFMNHNQTTSQYFYIQ